LSQSLLTSITFNSNSSFSHSLHAIHNTLPGSVGERSEQSVVERSRYFCVLRGLWLGATRGVHRIGLVVSQRKSVTADCACVVSLSENFFFVYYLSFTFLPPSRSSVQQGHQIIPKSDACLVPLLPAHSINGLFSLFAVALGVACALGWRHLR